MFPGARHGPAQPPRQASGDGALFRDAPFEEHERRSGCVRRGDDVLDAEFRAAKAAICREQARARTGGGGV
eukprot:11178354-Lingulodinium_polyedra.AAC.1